MSDQVKVKTVSLVDGCGQRVRVRVALPTAAATDGSYAYRASIGRGNVFKDREVKSGEKPVVGADERRLLRRIAEEVADLPFDRQFDRRRFELWGQPVGVLAMS